MSTRILVLGQGQLGLMLAEAGVRLGLVVDRLDPDGERLLPGSSDLELEVTAEGLLQRYSVITAEREQLPDTPLMRALLGSDRFVNNPAFELLPDRLEQKRLLDRLEVPTSPWGACDSEADLDAVRRSAGADLRVKLRRGGYDGRGQWHLRDGEGLPELPGPAIAEASQTFRRELSLVGARTANGKTVFYPLVENIHREGMLRLTLAPAARAEKLQARAEDWLERIMTELDYSGVMAMELFDTGSQLLVNELAPRVHNSGHWTQEGASLCQFELHLRALCGLPCPRPCLRGVSAMVNLVGDPLDPAWLEIPDTRLHWYGKDVRPGRKLGHLNVMASDHRQLRARLLALRGVPGLLIPEQDDPGPSALGERPQRQA